MTRLRTGTGLLAVICASAVAIAPATPAQADAVRAQQWGLQVVRAQSAWQYTQGTGVTVAVLDTGVDASHPDLAGSVINGPDYTGKLRKPGTPYWGRHGTAMASIIAGHGHGGEADAGVMGVAPKAKILSIRVTYENDDPLRHNKSALERTRNAVSRGIRYAVDHGAQVISMSLGGGTSSYTGSPAEREAVQYALDSGVLVIASAGNDGAAARKSYPAAYPGVLAVGAVGRDYALTSFSARQRYVAMSAPGEAVISAEPGGRYVLSKGTSPAGAFVAGVAALIRSEFPRLTPAQTRTVLTRGVRRPRTAGVLGFGSGIIDGPKSIAAGKKISDSLPDVMAKPQGDAESNGPDWLLYGGLFGGGVALIGGTVVLVATRRRRSDALLDDTDLPPIAPPDPAPSPPAPPQGTPPHGIPPHAGPPHAGPPHAGPSHGGPPYAGPPRPPASAVPDWPPPDASGDPRSSSPYSPPPRYDPYGAETVNMPTIGSSGPPPGDLAAGDDPNGQRRDGENGA